MKPKLKPCVIEFRGDLWLWRRRPARNLGPVNRISVNTSKP